MTWWTARDGGLVVAVRVVPGAKRSEIVDAAGDRLRVRVAARPVEGKANDELLRFLAIAFGVRPSAVSLVRGDHARDKTVVIAGLDSPPSELTRPRH